MRKKAKKDSVPEKAPLSVYRTYSIEISKEQFWKLISKDYPEIETVPKENIDLNSSMEFPISITFYTSAEEIIKPQEANG